MKLKHKKVVPSFKLGTFINTSRYRIDMLIACFDTKNFEFCSYVECIDGFRMVFRVRTLRFLTLSNFLTSKNKWTPETEMCASAVSERKIKHTTNSLLPGLPQVLVQLRSGWRLYRWRQIPSRTPWRRPRQGSVQSRRAWRHRPSRGLLSRCHQWFQRRRLEAWPRGPPSSRSGSRRLRPRQISYSVDEKSIHWRLQLTKRKTHSLSLL